MVLRISEELTSREKIYLTMTSKQMDTLKYKFIYKQKVKIYDIIGLPYFDNFECVDVLTSTTKCPKAAKYVHLYTLVQKFPPFVTHLFYDHDRYVRNIPQSVTHLILGGDSTRPAQGRGFNKSIKNCIPLSVTNLVFGCIFNQPICGSIPHSVTHLKFGKHFNKSVRDLPLSVTHLILGQNFNKFDTFSPTTNIIYLQMHCYYCHHELKIPSVKYLEILHFDFIIEKNIPQSVTHLTLHNYVGSMLKSIPKSVTHLTFGNDFDRSIKYLNISSVTHIYFADNYKHPIKRKWLPDSVIVIKVGENFL